jgi:hypothetical protein
MKLAGAGGISNTLLTLTRNGHIRLRVCGHYADRLKRLW